MCKKFIERSLHEKEFKETIKQVAKMDRNELLRDRARENNDSQTILVRTWHPILSAIPSISKIFKQKPTVTYRKTIRFREK